VVVYAADAQILREVGEAILASGHPVTVNAGTWEIVMFLDEVSAD
jgi:hypothetical protein